ncbi:DUF5963 family protein [Desulfuromonas sp. TF]|uniref:DUF5963 family protein n=1 Tax=Desulfuromonas sp. TF TaxID=1232410 RepID=UPI00047F32D7|nr:DUF5963 family protein [Desulfuromonas sp. TF]
MKLFKFLKEGCKKVYHLFDGAFSIALNFITFFLFLLSFLFIVIFISMGATYISLSSGQQPIWLFGFVTNQVVLLMTSMKGLPSDQYMQFISKTYNIISLILTLLLSCFPVYAIFNIKKINTKQRIIKIQKLRDNDHEISMMMKHFRNADDIVIYASTFGPLRNQLFADMLYDKAINHKLKLVSSTSRERVEAAIGEEVVEMFSDFFEFDSNSGEIRCSYIKYGSLRKFIYKFSKSEYLDNREYLASITDDHPSGDTKHLLWALDYLS